MVDANTMTPSAYVVCPTPLSLHPTHLPSVPRQIPAKARPTLQSLPTSSSQCQHQHQHQRLQSRPVNHSLDHRSSGRRIRRARVAEDEPPRHARRPRVGLRGGRGPRGVGVCGMREELQERGGVGQPRALTEAYGAGRAPKEGNGERGCGTWV